MTTERPGQGAQSVDRALSILSEFVPGAASHSLTKLSELTGLTISTTHRLLKALQRHGYVVLDPETRQYSLGPETVRLAGVVAERDDLQTIAVPLLRRLRTATGETVELGWIIEDELAVVTVREMESFHPIRMKAGVGRSFPIWAGASRAALAFMDEGLIEEALKRADDPSLWPLQQLSRKDLLDDLEFARREGYSNTSSEFVPNAAAIGAPVRDSVGYPVALIVIVGPSDRWTDERRQAHAPRLLATARTIEKALGFGGNGHREGPD